MADKITGLRITEKGIAAIQLGFAHAATCAGTDHLGLDDAGQVCCDACGWAATPPDPRAN